VSNDQDLHRHHPSVIGDDVAVMYAAASDAKRRRVVVATHARERSAGHDAIAG
jgi:hypothetical protein